MNTLSHLSSPTAPTIQYMHHHPNMPSSITTSTMPIPPLNANSTNLLNQHDSSYYPYATSKISAESDIPLLLGEDSGISSPVATSMTVASHHNQQHAPQPGQPRKRTRATSEQLAVLEKTFSTNPTPNNRLREQLSRDLRMPERSIQIWFQNRRAKAKNIAKRSSGFHNEIVRMQYYAATAASAACQATAYHHQQAGGADGKSMSIPDLYYYYYYYYYNQQVQDKYYFTCASAATIAGNRNVSSPLFPLAPSNFVPQSAPPPPPMMVDVWSTPPPPPPPATSVSHHHRWGLSNGVPSPTSISNGRLRAHSLSPYPLPRDGSVDTVATATTMMASVSAYHHYHQQHRSRSYTSPADYWSSLPYMQQEQQQQQQESQPQVSQPPTPPLDESDPSSISATTTQFPVEALQIGTWGRMRLHPADLVCHYNTQLRTMVWHIQSGPQQFKMEFNFDTILHMCLKPLLEERLGWARLELRIAQPEAIMFYMKDPNPSSGSAYWTQCSDFTQDSQATTVHMHHLDGPALSLRAALQQLVQSDAHLQSIFVDSSVDMIAHIDSIKAGGSGSCSDADVQLFQGIHHPQTQE